MQKVNSIHNFSGKLILVSLGVMIVAINLVVGRYGIGYVPPFVFLLIAFFHCMDEYMYVGIAYGILFLIYIYNSIRGLLTISVNGLSGIFYLGMLAAMFLMMRLALTEYDKKEKSGKLVLAPILYSVSWVMVTAYRGFSLMSIVAIVVYYAFLLYSSYMLNDFQIDLDGPENSQKLRTPLIILFICILLFVGMLIAGDTSGHSSRHSGDEPWKDLGVSEKEYMDVYADVYNKTYNSH